MARPRSAQELAVVAHRAALESQVSLVEAARAAQAARASVHPAARPSRQRGILRAVPTR